MGSHGADANTMEDSTRTEGKCRQGRGTRCQAEFQRARWESANVFMYDWLHYVIPPGILMSPSHTLDTQDKTYYTAIHPNQRHFS